jgi:hypothetical protein
MFELKCGEGIVGMPYKEEPCPSLAECAKRCAEDAKCVHSTLVEKTGKCGLKDGDKLFQREGIATWFFVKNVDNTDKPTPVNTGDGTQKPVGNENTAGNENTVDKDPNNKSSYSCPSDSLARYTT